MAAGKQVQQQQPAAGMSLLDLEDDYDATPKKSGLDEAEKENLRKAAGDANEKLDRLGKIRRERDEVLKDLKEKVRWSRPSRSGGATCSSDRSKMTMSRRYSCSTDGRKMSSRSSLRLSLRSSVRTKVGSRPPSKHQDQFCKSSKCSSDKSSGARE